MRKLESFSPPCPFPTSQSLPITSTPLAATVKRRKRVVEVTKIYPSRCPTKQLLISHKSAHPSCKSRKQRTQTSKCIARVICLRCQSTVGRAPCRKPKTPPRPHLLLICSYVFVVSNFQANLFGSEREEEMSCLLAWLQKKTEKEKIDC
jgi:hypothetical protein